MRKANVMVEWSAQANLLAARTRCGITVPLSFLREFSAAWYSRHNQWGCSWSEDRSCCELQEETTFITRRPSRTHRNATKTANRDKETQTPDVHHFYCTAASVDAPRTRTPPEICPRNQSVGTTAPPTKPTGTPTPTPSACSGISRAMIHLAFARLEPP